MLLMYTTALCVKQPGGHSEEQPAVPSSAETPWEEVRRRGGEMFHSAPQMDNGCREGKLLRHVGTGWTCLVYSLKQNKL